MYVAVNVGSSSVKILVESDEHSFELRESQIPIGEHAETVLSLLEGIDAENAVFIHRVVHGYDRRSPEEITGDVLRSIEAAEKHAPLHQKPERRVIEATQKTFGGTHYAVYDTSFHRTIPRQRKRYALPRQYNGDDWKQYGFHGISVADASQHIEHSGVVLHLGSGCSVTAVENGESKGTSMGLTPLSGCVMHTRPGNLDPGVVLRLVEDLGGVDEAEHVLYEESGWYGLTGTHHLLDIVESENPKDEEAVDTFVSSVAAETMRVAAALPTIDTVVFTGGVGENNAYLRKRICTELALLNIHLHGERNQRGENVVSHLDSPVKVVVHPAREEQTMIDMVREL